MDKSGQCAVVHAALRGHVEILQYLLELDWVSDSSLRSRVLHQAFIAASSMGHIQVKQTHNIASIWNTQTLTFDYS